MASTHLNSNRHRYGSEAPVKTIVGTDLNAGTHRLIQNGEDVESEESAVLNEE